VSEWGLQEREERDTERRKREEEMGAEEEERLEFLAARFTSLSTT